MWYFPDDDSDKGESESESERGKTNKSNTTAGVTTCELYEFCFIECICRTKFSFPSDCSLYNAERVCVNLLHLKEFTCKHFLVKRTVKGKS